MTPRPDLLDVLPFADTADQDPNALPFGDEWPRVNADGVTVWACCESSIGPVCQHRAVPS